MKRLFYAIAAVTATAAAAVVGGAAAPASAVSTSTGCTPISGGTSYLSAYYDNTSYVLVPGGDFSSTSSPWTLSGASVSTSLQAPANVTGSAGTGALVVRSGGTAAAPKVCMGGSYKTFQARFFYKAPAGTRFVVKTTGTSSLGSYTINTTITAPSSGWNLTPTIAIPGWTDGSGTQWSKIAVVNNSGQSVVVDDVLVDPWRARGW